MRVPRQKLATIFSLSSVFRDPVTTPDGQYFMIGDNRDNSEDSRYWGFLPKSHVKGQALFIYFSFDDGEPLTNLVGGVRWSRLLDRVR